MIKTDDFIDIEKEGLGVMIYIEKGKYNLPHSRLSFECRSPVNTQ